MTTAVPPATMREMTKPAIAALSGPNLLALHRVRHSLSTQPSAAPGTGPSWAKRRASFCPDASRARSLLAALRATGGTPEFTTP